MSTQRFNNSRYVFVVSFIVILGLSMPAGLSQSNDTYWPTNGWRTSTPEKQGMNSEKLAEGMDFCLKNEFNIHNLLVIRNGHIVVDAYFHPFAPNTKHDLASVTKSITSTLIGIAIDKGFIKSLEQPVLDFFPHREIIGLSIGKRSMNIENLLTMRSGLECNTSSGEATLFKMLGSPDWIQFMLDLPMTHEPGKRFVYNSGGVYLLSAVIRQATGKTSLAFAREHLFRPLGILDASWPMDPQGVSNYGFGSLRLTPHDVAKIGFLYLNKGRWEDGQILSSRWVESATSVPASVKVGQYGYLWWLHFNGGYSASGRGGQYLRCIPDKKLIIVTTGGGEKGLNQLLGFYIIPSIISDDPLPANPNSLDMLHDKIRQAAVAPVVEPVPVLPIPNLAKRISGCKYKLEPNRLRITDLTLTFTDPNEAFFQWSFLLDSDGNPTKEYRVGLDQVPRITKGRFGLPASAKGFWKTENTFKLDLDEIGNINRFHITLTFKDNTVTGQVIEKTGLGKLVIQGRS